MKLHTLVGCLDSSLAEAIGALTFLLDVRTRSESEKKQSSVRHAVEAQTLASGFAPDLGLRLARDGGSATTFYFEQVPIFTIGVLPDGSASWSANIALGDSEYIATFDVPSALRNDLARTLGMSPDTLRPGRGVVKHRLEGRIVELTCRLGSIQHSENETFCPLVVEQLVPIDSPGDA